jgi:hypothetical protein
VLWFLIWALLVVLAGGVLGRLARGGVRRGIALLTEMGQAAERLSAIAEQVERIGEQRQPATEPAVFADPYALRLERDRKRRARRRRAARAAAARLATR